jgi:hypothetical protein
MSETQVLLAEEHQRMEDIKSEVEFHLQFGRNKSKTKIKRKRDPRRG